MEQFHTEKYPVPYGNPFVRSREPIVWKKAYYEGKGGKRVGCLVKLSLPEGTFVHLGDNHGHNKHLKCRASQVRVLGFYTMKSKKLPNSTEVFAGFGRMTSKFFYTVGSVVLPRKPFVKLNKTCASGIHFFFSKRAAERY
jgi:hypothetical protein